jgi:prefoldin beta subunit
MSNPYANLPPQLQNEMMQFQNLGEQINLITQQKYTIESNIKEKDAAINELEGLEDDVVVYKQVGGILVKKTKASVLEDLKNDKLTFEMRKKTLERNETNYKKKFDEMKNSIEEKLKNRQ